MRLLIILLCVALASPAQAWWLVSRQVVSGGGICSAAPSYSQEIRDSFISSCDHDLRTITGGQNSSSGPYIGSSVCRIDIYVYGAITGDITLNNYELRIYEGISQDGTFGELKGTSDTVAGSSIVPDSFNSFVFNTTVSIDEHDYVGVAIAGGGYDSSNYFRISVDNSTALTNHFQSFQANSSGSYVNEDASKAISMRIYETE